MNPTAEVHRADAHRADAHRSERDSHSCEPRDATATSASVATTPTGPGVVVDVEMSQPLPTIFRHQNGFRYDAAWLVVRVFGEPVGMVRVPFTGAELTPAQAAAAVESNCGTAVDERVAAAHGDLAGARSGAGCGPVASVPFLADQERWRREGPAITVAVCTRNRPVELRRTLLSLQQQSYPRFEVLVVDNAPTDTVTADVVQSLQAQGLALSYSVEPRPGLSWARNHALQRIATPVVAWLDDDEVADPHWLTEIAGGFCTHPDAAAVSGSVVPARLDTHAQLLFEEYGGHTKGRGFRAAAFRGANPNGQSAMYPLPAFGVGANMAFDVTALRSLGGFDVALGAGTPTLGGEDTLVFSQLLLREHLVLYRPSALTRHYHRADYPSLQRQMAGYGIGLTAYYTSLLRYDWRLFVPLARLAPRALRDTFGRHGDGLASVSKTFPQDLLTRKTRGMLKGPLAYVRSYRAARRQPDGTQ